MKISFFLLLTVALLVSCSKGGGGGSKAKISPAKIVSKVTFNSLDTSTVLPNDDIVLNGNCESSEDNVPFVISVNGATKEAICSGGVFEVTFLSTEITPGPVVISATDEKGQSIAGSGVVNAVKSPCNGNQDYDSGASACEDKPITSPSAQIPSQNITNVSGIDYVTSPNLTFDLDSTLNARSAIIFSSGPDCADYISNNCQVDSTVPVCSVIQYEVKNIVGLNSFSYSLQPGSAGVASEVSVLLANGLQLSSCISKTVTLDNASPDLNVTIGRVVINNPVASPVVNFGGAVSDIAGSGLNRIEVGVGSSATSPNLIPYATIPNASVSHSVDLSGITITAGNDYFLFVRAYDNVGNVATYISQKWEFQSCTAAQDLVGDNCNDKAIQTPQLIVNGSTLYSTNEVVSSNNLSLSSGTTALASKAFVMVGDSVCSDFLSSNCHIDPNSSACSILTFTEIAPSTNMSFTVAGMAHNTSTSINVIYSNGSATSVCVAKEIFLDNVAPIITASLTKLVTHEATKSPLLNVGVVDSGLSGVSEYSYALSSDGVSDDLLGFTSLSTAATNLTAELSSGTLASATDYFVMIKSVDGQGNESSWISPAFRYVPCGSTQSLSSGSCVDNAVSNVQLLATSGTVISTSRFVTSIALNFSNGTTSNVLNLFLFETPANCTSFSSLGCEVNPLAVGCSAIARTEVTPSASMAYSSSTLVTGGSVTIAGLYTNGTTKSSCVSQTISMDTRAPTFTLANAQNLTRTMSTAPTVTFNSGAVIADLDGSGIDKIQYGISSDGITANVLDFQDISSALTSYAPDLSGALVVVGVDYYTAIKAIDKLGNEKVVMTNAWRYTSCSLSQNTEADGSCTELPIEDAMIASGDFIYDQSGIWISNATINLGIGTTLYASHLNIFESAADCAAFSSNNCHLTPASGACTAISKTVLDVNDSLVYTVPGIADNTPTPFYGLYTNGTHKDSCIETIVNLNAPEIDGLTLSEPLYVVKTVHDYVPPFVNMALTMTDDVKPNDLVGPVASTDSVKTVSNGAFSRNLATTIPFRNPPVGYDSDISGEATAGILTECFSNVDNVDLSCIFDVEQFTSKVDTYDLAIAAPAPAYLFFAPGKSVVIPYKIYTSTQMTIRAGNVADTTATSASMFGTAFNGEFYFMGTNPSLNTKLFKTDGTSIYQVSNTAANDNTAATYPIEFAGELYFSSKNASALTKVYKTDGLTYIKRVSDMRAGVNDTWTNPIVFESQIYFGGHNGTNSKIMRYNGTKFHSFSNIRTGNDWVAPWTNFVYSGKLYTTLYPTGIDRIYAIQSGAIQRFSNIHATVGEFFVRKPTIYNGFMYFAANDSASMDTRLYKTNGTTITKITNFNTGNPEGQALGGDSVGNLIVHNGFLYFSATNADGYLKLFKLNTADEISQVSDLNPLNDIIPVPSVSSYQAMYDGVVCNGELFFPMYSGQGYSKIHKVDGNRIVQVTNIRPGLHDNPQELTCVGTTLYFKASNSAGILPKLWKLQSQTIQ